MKKNIVLIGMPAAGKSTIGVLLAKSAGLAFVDTDLEIQRKTNSKLQEIINKSGIEHFLKIEEEVIARLAVEESVIATGGSAVYSQRAMSHLKENGIIVFLKVPLCDIKKRLDNISTRGIAMSAGSTLDSIFLERMPLYEKYADITVDASLDCAEAVVEQIISKTDCII